MIRENKKRELEANNLFEMGLIKKEQIQKYIENGTVRVNWGNKHKITNNRKKIGGLR
jgi:hypothetical protein